MPWFQIEGVPELRKYVADLAPQAAKANREFVVAAQKVIQSAARANAPRRSGRLRSSIRSSPPRQIGMTTVSGYVRSRRAYAPRVEVGFHGTDSLGRNYDQSAQPFFRPAVEASMPAIAALYNAMVAQALGTSALGAPMLQTADSF